MDGDVVASSPIVRVCDGKAKYIPKLHAKILGPRGWNRCIESIPYGPAVLLETDYVLLKIVQVFIIYKGIS